MKDGHAKARQLLRADPLQHIVTLKMLHLAGDAVDCRLVEESQGWALLSVLPANAFEYDRKTYADRDFVVLIDGPSGAAKARFLDQLPGGRLVIKLSDEALKARLSSQWSVKPVRSFISFTGTVPPQSAPAGSDLSESGKLTGEVLPFFESNGYEADELERYFADGARWFGIRLGAELAAACFTFRNFENVWEIGGVLTKPAFRRRGLARRVVAAALRHVLREGNLPRYQVRSDNLPSIRLADAAGLRRFLKVDHYLIENR